MDDNESVSVEPQTTVVCCLSQSCREPPQFDSQYSDKNKPFVVSKTQLIWFVRWTRVADSLNVLAAVCIAAMP